MREIVLDTETTGLRPNEGDRLVEIGCIELINHMPSGNNFHKYVNPERDMPDEAFRVHGLSEEFLSQHPVFSDIAQDLVAYLGDAPLIIHNASFDMGFINAELKGVGLPTIPMERTVDTVIMARRKFPGSPASLDALCRRFNIDNSSRTLHGALLDAELLAEVYLELIGGREPGLALSAEDAKKAAGEDSTVTIERPYREPRPHAPDEAELAAHLAFIKRLEKPLWLQESEA